ncbi:RNA pseudouridine synthase [Hydrocarboniphaga sp.]|uniref:RNA pseudouridine synthase n=1 Tax=Hydrocarboniphaga sp. TaxID=2033016 RepID=UPI003D13AA1C
MSEPIRLAKTVVALTQCSRREAELYIEGGWVTVDGQVVEEPQHMITDQRVELLPDAKPEPIEPVTIVMHKPAGYDSDEGDKAAWKLLGAESRVTEHTDPAMRTLRRHFARLSVPMRLAANASGLLVLTRDFQVNKKLSDEASRIEQEYSVEVSGTIAEGGLEQLNRGITANGWKLPTCKVSWQSEQRLRFAAKDIRVAHIESMCEAAGLQAIVIKRIRIGSVAMGKLQPGQWRYLPPFKRF